MKKNLTERASGSIVRAVCLLLIAVSLLSVTFARYITTSSPDPSIGVSPFAYSFSVDTTNTGYVFDNADYKHENLVMNTPQITPFTVSNAETRDGKEVITPEYDDVFTFKEDLCCVEKDETFGFIDRSGNLVVPIAYECASSFSEGYACVFKGGVCGYIDKTGETVIPFK